MHSSRRAEWSGNDHQQQGDREAGDRDDDERKENTYNYKIKGTMKKTLMNVKVTIVTNDEDVNKGNE